MSKGSPRVTIRMQRDLYEAAQAAMNSANETRQEEPYDFSGWILEVNDSSDNAGYAGIHGRTMYKIIQYNTKILNWHARIEIASARLCLFLEVNVQQTSTVSAPVKETTVQPGDKVTVQGMPGVVVKVDPTMTPPSAQVVVEVPQVRWVPLTQLNSPPPGPPAR